MSHRSIWLPVLANCACLTLLVSPSASGGELAVSTDFPGGSAQVLELDSAGRRIVISPAVHAERGWPCWWYLRVDGATPGETVTLQLERAAQEFRPGQRLTANWSLPQRAAVSSDDARWEHTPPGEITAERGVYSIVAPAARFWLAWGPPFLPSQAETLLQAAEQRLAGSAQRFVLSKTLQGRNVNALRIGDARRPLVVWVQARQHAWESGGSWVGKGFLDWVTSDDPQANALRERAEIVFIPIMDVDNVTLGAGGKEAIPRDHNRDWADEPVYPEVAAAQRELLQLIESGRLRAYIDLHNPGPADKLPYYYGPFDYDTLSPARRTPFDRFLELSIEHIRDPLPITPKYRLASYVKTDEERGRMSGEWVRRRIGEQGVAMTLETAWNTPYSTTEGYEAVGAGLARALAAFCLESNSR
jgi:hypothetical protein